MTIWNKSKRRTTITHERLEILAKGLTRRRHKVAVARAMLGITVYEPEYRHAHRPAEPRAGHRPVHGALVVGFPPSLDAG
jgi:hypothetical protein